MNRGLIIKHRYSGSCRTLIKAQNNYKECNQNAYGKTTYTVTEVKNANK